MFETGPIKMMDKVIKGIRNPGKGIDHLRMKSWHRWYQFRRWWIFRTAPDHTTAYRRWMRFRIKHEGPLEAVGGMSDEIGQLQFEFLKEQGLKPSNRLLDLGCGSLRGGEHFIQYLNRGNYVGMDVSKDIILEGKNRLERDLLDSKSPEFIVNDDLQLDEIADRPTFEFMLAQSVLTHLPKSKIDELFANLYKAIGSEGVLYATFFEDTGPESPKDFAYSTNEMESLAEPHGLEIEFLSFDAYPHPRGQRMMEILIAH